MGESEQAFRRLQQALAEQARCGELYARSIDTSAEVSSYVRLQAAALRVSLCDRLARDAPASGAGSAEA
ncbi:MAG: hypothetical protein NVSMB25_26240 [Thermoleophilaceae bacterium]